jgi:hypothetical protein
MDVVRSLSRFINRERNMPNETNKLFVGQIGLLLLIVFSAGGLVFQVSSLADDVEENTHHPVSKAEVEVMKVKQEAIREDVADIKEEQKEQGKTLDEILRLVK